MKVFISWSGHRSGALAEALHAWLPLVIQDVEPWLSRKDLDKGARWALEIAKELEGSKVGIICLTPENLDRPWILFESGALSKTLESTHVCTYLFELEASMIQPPLGQFQSTTVEKEDTRKLVHTINGAKPKPVDRARLDELFDALWPKLEAKIQAIPDASAPTPKPRDERDVLQEILGSVRRLEEGLAMLGGYERDATEIARQEIRDYIKSRYGTLTLGSTLGSRVSVDHPPDATLNQWFETSTPRRFVQVDTREDSPNTKKDAGEERS